MGLKNNFEKFSYYLKRYGLATTSKKVLKRVLHIKEDRKTNQEQYEIWMENNILTSEILEKQRQTKFKYEPKISIVVPMYNTEKAMNFLTFSASSPRLYLLVDSLFMST